jgi:hypothetical protein
VPSGKKSKQARQAAQVKAPPPVQSKGILGRGRAAKFGSFWWITGGIGVIAAIVIVIAIAVFGGSAKPVRVDFAQMPGLQTGPPPWNNGSGVLQDKLSFVQLTPLAQEALAFHIHMHLDVYVNGKHVGVPALIGIFGGSFITEIHTHTPDGVIHVESAENRPYTLGQLFGEWGVRVSASCLGRYCGNVHWWVNGKPQTGDAADLVFHAHQEIVIAAGKLPARIRSSYNFPAGE